MANALQAATDGLPIGIMYEGDKRVIINLKVRDNNYARLTDMEDVPVWSMMPNIVIDDINMAHLSQGTLTTDEITEDMFRTVPLSQVSDGLDLRWEESAICRYDGQRAIEVQCDPAYHSTPTLARKDIRENVEGLELPAGYSMQWLGESKTQNTAISNILGYLPIVMIIILIILLLLFNSVKKMLLILFCLPFAAIGVTIALLVTNTPMTFIGIIGAMGLIGMIVTNAIVLVDEISRMIKEGAQPYRAVVESTVNRTRPVVMASATTILGMLPLILDPMYGSLAVVVIGGLTIGTIVTLILVPIFYSLLFKVKSPKEIVRIP